MRWAVLTAVLSVVLATREVDVEADADSLAFVHVVWRHGDRSPGRVFTPSDEAKWPNGLGELTENGVRQHYRLGQWLWKRYGRWLGSPVDRNEIYIRSSDYNRTLMSAMANLAGMIPPQSEVIPGIKWQPIPVHTVPKYLDRQLYEDIECHVAEEETKSELGSSSALELMEEYRNLVEFIGVKSGLGRPLEIDDIQLYFDNLFCQQRNNITWPSWMTNEKFYDLTQLYYKSSKYHFRSEVLKKLRGGTLLKEIVSRLQQKEDGTSTSKKKYYAYSAHDTTIAALLSTLGIDFDVFPLYATALMVEMHRNDNGVSLVRIFHKNETDVDTVFEYSIPGCPAPCAFKQFAEDYQKYFPTDWAKECGVDTQNGGGKMGIVINLVLAAMIVFLIYRIHQEKRKMKMFVKQMKSDGTGMQLLGPGEEF